MELASRYEHVVDTRELKPRAFLPRPECWAWKALNQVLKALFNCIARQGCVFSTHLPFR